MAGLEPLLPFIYQEKQQPGSQICAQHALNSILQGDYFQAPDLAQFADQLDQLEGSVNKDIGPSSQNMDDTGFFSVDVLEGALRVWGFTLVRWRNPALRDEQDRPHAQMAFILNHQQHWFALRRFGDLHDPDNGHWFNLNSFLPHPEWVSKLYLGMVLSQAESEGYSVFAVRPIDEASGIILPHTEADEIAMTLSQPTSTNIAIGGFPDNEKKLHDIPGVEDEDYELQAALQASLTSQNYDYNESSPSSEITNLTPPQHSAIATISAAHYNDVPEEQDDITANMARNQARNKAIIEQMKREQEMALRETYEENYSNGMPNARRRRTVGEEEEEDALRRAIESSQTNAAEPFTPGNALELTSDNSDTWNDRVYDDEDSELQAALKASLEGLPEGFVLPSTPPRLVPSSSRLPPVTQTSTTDGPIAPESQEVDAEELRKRRLARFGGT